MSNPVNRRAFTALLSSTFLVGPSFAEEAVTDAVGRKVIEVQMLNRHPEEKGKSMVFYPRIIQANLGDTIRFIATDKSHNVASTKGMLPEGVDPFRSDINADFEMTVQTPGIYGLECTPHRTMGMVALVVVEGDGKLDNLQAAKAARKAGRAKAAWSEIWEEAQVIGLLD